MHTRNFVVPWRNSWTAHGMFACVHTSCCTGSRCSVIRRAQTETSTALFTLMCLTHVSLRSGLVITDRWSHDHHTHTHTLSRVQAAHSNKKTGTFLNVFYHHDFTSVVYWRVDVYYLVFKTNNVNYQWSGPAVQKWFHHVLKEQRILNSD